MCRLLALANSPRRFRPLPAPDTRRQAKPASEFGKPTVRHTRREKHGAMVLLTAILT
jgi:hypothetical protein